MIVGTREGVDSHADLGARTGPDASTSSSGPRVHRQPPDPADLDALADVARWTGSSRNSQPWRFIVITDRRVSGPFTKPGCRRRAALATGAGRDRDRPPGGDPAGLEAPTTTGGSPSVSWSPPDPRHRRRDQLDPDGRPAADGAILGLPDDRMVRTIVPLGHPTEAARAQVRARRSPSARDETVYEERWPQG